MHRIVQHIIDILHGISMAIADSVPGVSGGTVAFILGFYEKFISSVHSLLLGTNAERKAAIPFMFKLGCGWVGGFVVCVLILSELFHTYIYEISSVFIGLTLASVPIVILEEKESIKGHSLHLIFMAIGIAVVPVLMLSLSPVSEIDLANGSIGLAVFLFVAAIIAITALVFPGISGATLLFIMGLYVPLISAVSAVVRDMEFSYIPMLFAYCLGVIAGFAISTKVLRHCFARYRSQTIYLCIGLLIGSLYAIVQGPKPTMSWETFSLGYCLLGAAIPAVLQAMKRSSP